MIECIRDLLTPEECLDFIRWAEDEGYEVTGRHYPASYRDNDRLVRDEPALAAKLMPRLESRLPATLRGKDGTRWSLKGLNPRFRSCRYRNGQSFCRHRDGAHSPEPRLRSFITVMLYLNDSREFQGGATRFYQDRWVEQPQRIVAPEAGMAIVFDHSLWHDGQPVTEGTKYVLRTDVLYESEVPASGHRGYVWDLVELPGGRLASGSRDKTVRIWGVDMKEEAVLTGHEASVTSLCWVGNSLWSGSRDHTLIQWWLGPDGWSLKRRFEGHQGAVLCLTPGPDGILSGGADGQLRSWFEDGTLSQAWRCPSWPWAVGVEADGIWVGCEGGELLRSSARNLEQMQTVGVPIRGLLSNPLILGCGDGTLRVGPQVWPGHRGPVTSLARVGSAIISGGEDDGVRWWEDGRSRELLCHDDFVRKVLVTTQGNLVTASYDGRILKLPIPVPAPSASQPRRQNREVSAPLRRLTGSSLR